MPSQPRVTPDRAILAGLLLTAAAYCRDLKFDFVLDDLQLILMNQATVSWVNLKTIFTTDVFFVRGPSVPIAMASKHYRPIFMLWLMLNQQLFGSVFPWWHLTSLLLHLVAVFLVYKLGMKLLKDPWAAALAALLFAFHPIHIESVSYVSASTDVLVTIFLLLSFVSYVQFREGGSSLHLILAVFTAALAILSKETAGMFPFMLIAYELFAKGQPGTERRWSRFFWTAPFVAVVAAYLAVRTALLGANAGPGPGGNRFAALADVPLVLITYLRNMLWSFRLSFFYPVEWAAQWTLLKGAAVLLTLGAVVFLWRHYRDRSGVRLLLAWTAILFVPPLIAVTTFVKEDWVHDRHMYLVSVPFLLIVATVLTDRALPRKACMVAASVILLVLLTETTVQVSRFNDGTVLFQSALKVAPNNALAHRYLAFSLCGFGRYDECFAEFRIASKLWPWEPTIHGSYADGLISLGRDEEAAAEYTKALQLSPKRTPYRAYLLYRLGTIRVEESKFTEGEACLREAVEIAPDTPSYHALLAQALREQGRAQEADQQMKLETVAAKDRLRAYPTP